MQKEHADQLHSQALLDLTMRAKPGIFIYLAVWLVFVFGFDFWELSPTFIIVNSVVIVLLLAFRLLHLLQVNKATKPNTKALYQFLISGILFSALHWGVLTAVVLSQFQESSAYHLMLVVLAALAMGGASVLSISNTLRFFYPLALYAPSFLVFLSIADASSLIYGLCMVLSYAYTISASKYSRDTYWSAVKNHLIAEERAELLERLSITDPLTQLKNRMYFESKFDEEWKRSIRLQSSLSVLMIDFDHFKGVNDSLGHLFGDHVLKQVSQHIATELKRSTDLIARYGGEEFVVLLPSTDATGAKIMGERIRKAVEDMVIVFQGEEMSVTCSVGGASTVPRVGDDKMSLVKHADNALYQAKNRGRNCYCAFELSDEGVFIGG